MSKTYLDQVAKATSLVEGLRNNFDRIAKCGISNPQIDELEKLAKEAELLNADVEELRAKASAAVKMANAKLAELKGLLLPMKNSVKASFLQPEWMEFGIADKR